MIDIVIGVVVTSFSSQNNRLAQEN